jgi:hypothetical protein
LLFVVPWTAAATPRAGALEVLVASSRVTLNAREAPLAELLAAIGQKAGVKIVLLGKVDELITDKFTDLPIDDALKRVARHQSVVFIYGAPREESRAPSVREVWITGPSSGSDRSGTDSADTGHATNEVREAPFTVAGAPDREVPRPSNPALAMSLKFGQADNRDRLIGTLIREQGQSAAIAVLREAATQDPDLRVRRGAIQALSSMETPEAVEAIMASLNDPRASVRSEAREALRRLSRPRPSDDSSDSVGAGEFTEHKNLGRNDNESETE